MNALASPFDVIHFEALGPEAQHLKDATAAKIAKGELPASHRMMLTPLTVQDYLAQNPTTVLPSLVTTKTHSVVPEGFFSTDRRPGIVTRSAGYDHFEHIATRAHVASLREYCVEAVAQTAIKFVYCMAGNVHHYADKCARFDRKSCEGFTQLGPHLTLSVFGVGRIGKRILELASANGLTVQGVDVRENALQKHYGNSVNFVTPEHAIATSNIVVNAMNLTKDRASAMFNVGYFHKGLLEQAKQPLLFVNVTRGEIAPESVLLPLLQSGAIAGLGLDVFSHESKLVQTLGGASTNDPDIAASVRLIELANTRAANVYVQPHQAFNSDIAAKTKADEAMVHVVAWFNNKGERFDEELPYY